MPTQAVRHNISHQRQQHTSCSTSDTCRRNASESRSRPYSVGFINAWVSFLQTSKPRSLALTRTHNRRGGGGRRVQFTRCAQDNPRPRRAPASSSNTRRGQRSCRGCGRGEQRHRATQRSSARSMRDGPPVDSTEQNHFSGAIPAQSEVPRQTRGQATTHLYTAPTAPRPSSSPSSTQPSGMTSRCSDAYAGARTKVGAGFTSRRTHRTRDRLPSSARGHAHARVKHSEACPCTQRGEVGGTRAQSLTAPTQACLGTHLARRHLGQTRVLLPRQGQPSA